jgi:hypothetical protein
MGKIFDFIKAKIGNIHILKNIGSNNGDNRMNIEIKIPSEKRYGTGNGIISESEISKFEQKLLPYIKESEEKSNIEHIISVIRAGDGTCKELIEYNQQCKSLKITIQDFIDRYVRTTKKEY